MRAALRTAATLSPLIILVDKSADGLPCVRPAGSLFFFFEHTSTSRTFCAEAPNPVEGFLPSQKTTGAEMTEAEEWKNYIAELRQVAARADDVERQRKLLDLAERWTLFAEELSIIEHDRR
ncbi:MAG TPA: hypothetical protein VN681_02345 [Stellaceae bacterium]|nr:hypothetical protein [Stellaceae bacterium]